MKCGTCSDCEAVYYYSKNCQKTHWSEYEVLCNIISELSRGVSKNIETLSNYNTCYTTRVFNKLLNLVGRESIVNYFVFDQRFTVRFPIF